jgi:hypothetical protein
MDANPLIGVRSLVSDVARSLTGQQVFPLGEDPTGQLIYSQTGHVAVTMARRGDHGSLLLTRSPEPTRKSKKHLWDSRPMQVHTTSAWRPEP